MTIEQQEKAVARWGLVVEWDGEEYTVYQGSEKIAGCRYRDVAIDLAVDVLTVRDEEAAE